ncbi:MAG: LysR family transcriptional regulator [Saprospiraceae bacterium]|nr:LysR family transcriptional regulator [Saprospiraceae bacterium]
MTLQQLDYALALAKYGSYSKAAQAVGITQPAMSLRIKKLEEGVGLVLFDRSQKPVRPTLEGKLFLEKAQFLLTQADQLRDFALGLQQEIKGEIQIGIIPTLAPYMLPLFINDLNQQFGELKLHIKEMLTLEIIEGLRSGTLHAGIISTPITHKTQFIIKPLFYERFLLFVSDDHPLFQYKKITVDQIPTHELWLLKEGNCFRDQVDNLCESSSLGEQQELFLYESSSIESLCRIVEHKGGITFLPELSTLHLTAEREDMIKEISGRPRVREISMIHLPNEVRVNLVDEVAKVIQKNIPSHMINKDPTEVIPTRVQEI